MGNKTGETRVKQSRNRLGKVGNKTSGTRVKCDSLWDITVSALASSNFDFSRILDKREKCNRPITRYIENRLGCNRPIIEYIEKASRVNLTLETFLFAVVL
ncbi:hypothetical protein, partial [Streptococcus acidominimus]|uniref:hypothetical protein n=1 Tax=Streptococcus acidominimus TaxID=1326 RepID=UPI001ADD83F9